MQFPFFVKLTCKVLELPKALYKFPFINYYYYSDDDDDDNVVLAAFPH